MFKISIIISTYNRPMALGLVLKALAAQSVKAFKYEVIIADDGSDDKTAIKIKQQQSQLPYPIKHIWQADQGFRAAKARNKAIAVATGDYLIFLDGDCIPQTDFLFKHQQLAETGWFVAGNRILLNQTLTHSILQAQSTIWNWGTHQWLRHYGQGHINRLLPLLRLPKTGFRKWRKLTWQGAKTCNLAVWHQDIEHINGFDEQFQGWGHEDAELVVRLFKQGIYRKEGRFAVPVFHLWHPPQNRLQETENRKRLEKQLQEM